MLGLERARPERRLRGRDVRAKIALFKKMTIEVPEIKFVKLLIIALTEKYTEEETLCWSNIYCLLQKATPLQQKSYLNYLVLV